MTTTTTLMVDVRFVLQTKAPDDVYAANTSIVCCYTPDMSTHCAHQSSPFCFIIITQQQQYHDSQYMNMILIIHEIVNET